MERTIYLAFSYMDYENPCDPIKAFASEDDAKAFVEQCRAYQETRPNCPVDWMQDLTDEQEAEFNTWRDTVEEPWEKAHPGGDFAWHRDGFGVMPIQLIVPEALTLAGETP